MCHYDVPSVIQVGVVFTFSTIWLIFSRFPGPYFTYSVSSDPGGTTASWQDAPAIITRAKETMEFYMREYGEVCGFEMNRLDAFSWVATGTRKVCYNNVIVHSNVSYALSRAPRR